MLRLLESVVFILLYYLICLSIYVVYIYWRERRVHKEEILSLLNEEFERFKQGQPLNPRSLKRIKFHFRNNEVKLLVYEFLSQKVEMEFSLVKQFLNEAKLTEALMNKKKLTIFETVYKIRLIGIFKLENYHDFLLQACQSNVVYVQNEAIQTISKSGDIPLLLAAIKCMGQENFEINEKILIESLTAFQGDHGRLQEIILEEFTIYPYRMKMVILNYCQVYKTLSIQKFFYDLFLAYQQDTEILIACLKYFMKVKNVAIKDDLIRLLKHERWEVRLFSVIALRNYREDTLRGYFEEMIKDRDWLVRRNSAMALYDLSSNKHEIGSILNSSDNYAADSMISILSEKDVLLDYIDLMNNPEKKSTILKEVVGWEA